MLIYTIDNENCLLLVFMMSIVRFSVLTLFCAAGANYSFASDNTQPFHTLSTLPNVVETVYADNPRIAAQRKIFEASGEGYNSALSGFLPTISLNYNKGRRRNRLGGAFDYFDLEDMEASIEQPIFSGGQNYYSLQAANHTIKTSEYNLRSLTQDVILSAIGAFLDVERDRHILHLSNDNKNSIAMLLEASNDRFAQGEATRTDVAQSRARLSRAESDFIQARGNATISGASFTRLVGYEAPDRLIHPKQTIPLPKTLDNAISLAEKNNPELLAAIFSEKQAKSAIKVEKGGLLPNVSLRAEMSRTQGGGFTGVNFDTDSILVNVTYPLYQGGAQYSRIRETSILHDQAKFAHRDTGNVIKENVISAWELYYTLEATIKAQQDAITAAEIALEGVKEEQLYGSRTVLDVLDAEQELFVARISKIRSVRDRTFAYYSLLASMGILQYSFADSNLRSYSHDTVIDNIKHRIIGY